VGTVILEYITARVVLMLLIINLLSVTLIVQHPSTQKELVRPQLSYPSSSLVSTGLCRPPPLWLGLRGCPRQTCTMPTHNAPLYEDLMLKILAGF